jgi:hypothetical protein
MSAEKRFRTIKNSSIQVLLDFGNKNTTNKPGELLRKMEWGSLMTLKALHEIKI